MLEIYSEVVKTQLGHKENEVIEGQALIIHVYNTENGKEAQKAQDINPGFWRGMPTSISKLFGNMVEKLILEVLK